MGSCLGERGRLQMNLGIALKISWVVGDQGINSLCNHRSNDVCVVDLLASNIVAAD